MRCPGLKDIVNLIGDEQALELVKQIGGVTYYFPPDGAKSRHVSINPESWQKLCAYFGGWVYVPKGESEIKAMRDDEIRRKREDGAAIIDLAIEYGLSDRRIRDICSASKKTRRNEGLPVQNMA